jgi:hypothetical protein
VSKIKIVGSQFSDTELTTDVCSHLRPILEFLEKRGNSYAHGTSMKTSRDGGATRLVSGTIDFDAIEAAFELPYDLELARQYRAIICRRCWCDIVEESRG